MSTLSLSLLGAIQISRDGQPITESLYGKALAVLAYLATESDRAHPRSMLAALLWPDLPEDRARHNLRQALTVLRKVIGQDGTTPCLVQQREALRFDPDGGGKVDVNELREAISQYRAHAHADPDRCVACARRLESAVALYQGDFLEGFSVPDSDTFEDWVQTWRQRLREDVTEALTDLASMHTAQGETEATLHTLRRLVEIDPLREEAHRALMLLLWRTGNRTAALAQYARTESVLDEELGVEPDDETTALYEAIRDGQAPPEEDGRRAPFAASLVRIPLPATRLVGRQQESEAILDLLAQPDCRLLSLTGPGGSGKTRLAIHLASEWARHNPGVACIVPLEPVHTSGELAPAVADALGLKLRGADPPDRQLLVWLRDRSGLLVLDSAEHLLDDLSLVPAMLAEAPGLKILVTSRERLHLPGEWVYAIEGLRFPRETDGDSFEGYDAVDLLTERLRQARAGAPLHHEERPEIVRICQLVDGMPLGIELAAAWAHTLTMAEIADGIRENLDFLHAPRGQPDHHLSMRAVFNSSWQMLTPGEQVAFKRLSVFDDGFLLDAAQDVTHTTIGALAALMSKSLLTRLPSGRYRMHQLLAQFGEELLRENPDEHAEIRDRHSRYYLGLLARHEALLRGENQPAAIAMIEGDIKNIRAAWRWAVGRGKLDDLMGAAFSYWLFFVIHGWMREGEATFGSMLDALESGDLSASGSEGVRTLALAMAQVYTGGFRSGIGRYNEAIDLLEAGIPVLATRDQGQSVGLGLNMLAAALILSGRHEEARERLRESLEHFRKSGDAWGAAFSLTDLGMVLSRDFADPDGEAFCEEGREAFRRLGDRRGQALAASNLAEIALGRDDHKRALRLYREALTLRQEVDDGWGVAMSRVQLGRVYAATGERERARDQLLGGMRIAWNLSIVPIVVEALGEIAALDLHEGDRSNAQRILAAVTAHPAAPGPVRERAKTLLGDEDIDIGQRDPAGVVNTHARALLAA